MSSGPLLILTRFIKGLAAAFTAPTGLSIITTNFAEGPARNKALSIYTVFGAGGYSSGLLFGGLMTGVGWRWTFLLPVPIALAALVAAYLLLPKDKPAEEGGHDLAGAALSTSAMLLLVYTVVTAPDVGWAAPRTVVSFVLVAALVAAFVLVESRVKHPLIRLGILRKSSLVRASLAIVAVAGSYFSWQFIVTIYFQDNLGWSPLRLALALLPVGLMVAASAVFSDKLVNRFGTTRIIAVTLATMAVGYLLFLRLDTSPSYLTMLLPALLLIGVGWIGFPAINIQATAGVDDEEQGLAAGVLQTSMQVGAAVVLAVTTAVIASGAEGADARGDARHLPSRAGVRGRGVDRRSTGRGPRPGSAPPAREPSPSVAGARAGARLDRRLTTGPQCPMPLDLQVEGHRWGCTMPHGSATSAGARGSSRRARRRRSRRCLVEQPRRFVHRAIEWRRREPHAVRADGGRGHHGQGTGPVRPHGPGISCVRRWRRRGEHPPPGWPTALRLRRHAAW